MTETSLLFRVDKNSEDELEIAKKYFSQIYTSRARIPSNHLVIGRYSCLPFYRELEEDLLFHNSRLINSFEQHIWIAHFDYYQELKEFTPRSWDDTNFYTCQHPGPFVVKGRTNSKKQKWNQLMFAPTKLDASKLASKLMDDMAIVEQGIIYREYIPLVKFEEGLHGLPFTNEWRFFFLGDKLISYGYYWSGYEFAEEMQISQEGIEFAQQVANIAKDYVNFFVVDIAEKESGGWILIELNDGQSSGLSEILPDNLYANLSKYIVDFKI